MLPSSYRLLLNQLNPMRTTPVSVPFFSRTRSEGWPHHGHTFSIYPCPLSFWLTLPRESCPRLDVVHPCVVFLACVNLELFLALSPGNSPSFLMVWPQYASFLASTVSNSSFFTPALLRTHSFVSLLSTKPAEFFLSPFISKASRRVSSAFTAICCYRPH